ncbi:hypothetical protein [Cytobacillus purgationiresistens]|uniref:Uncharacterized protein n=1 Tax=Cytobacillus purgationiresistens TaxID=863449 RepID=A0ABU0AEN5_9BACI|nr:hypothetical protein [Cytobacillus purgationiresistens]MDQ0269717.1 hypothetical protein [Cytobacillus purgationiresistens]
MTSIYTIEKTKKITFIIMSCLAITFTFTLIYFASIEGISATVLKEVEAVISDEEIDNLITDPVIQTLLQEESQDISAINLNDSDLPLKSKGQVVKKISENFSIKEIQVVTSKVKKGITPEDKSEIMDMITNRLSEEELTAIKVIAIQEMTKK